MTHPASDALATRLLTITELSVSFEKPGSSALSAVRGVTFHVDEGECVVILGESGSGKSVTAQALLGLHSPETARVSATRATLGSDVLVGPTNTLEAVRGQRMSMIFQDALSALNPVQRVGDQIAEMFQVHQKMGKKQARGRAIELMQAVQIPDSERRARNYPHEMSGGMRQRIVIAMALALEPELLIADEPTTALDVTVQSQILELLTRLRLDKNMALVMITHDVGVAAEMADRVVVMYAGGIVETGTAEEVLLAPRHPYTVGLLKSVPRANQAELPQPIAGGLPDPRQLPSGCVFAPRCDRAVSICHSVPPQLERDLVTGREAACHLISDSMNQGDHR